MTNSILGAIGRFWLEINAGAWRYCPETVQQRLQEAYTVFSSDLREYLRDQSDADFGRGWREGRAAGFASGWAERDLEAQRELALKNDHIQALMTMVESYRTQVPDASVTAAPEDQQPAVRIATPSLSYPRAPFH
jgi:hypothetical protein